ncbi:hypothetical protein Plec18167_004584 [Paecilomyces lecythidis]|uniref:Alcohol dehydrogenase-like C-terminal domain-containing protein n=1 Tax=Paecilomyces lecythidis TaxID=3004212 RepID=A0ABR3XS06_9EURO
MGDLHGKVNRAVWLSSFDSPADIVDLDIPRVTPGSAVIEVLATYLPPYSKDIHNGTLKLFNLFLPMVPNPSHIGRVYLTGSDAVAVKPGHLVFYNPWIKARDDPTVSIIQGHHGGEGPRGRNLMQGEWRDGSLQQYQRVPLEGLFILDEARLCGEFGYHPAELQDITLHSMAYGALIECGNIHGGDTVIIGPATGAFGASAVELALLLGANVVALGRSENKLKNIGRKLGFRDQYRYVAMTGNMERDVATILDATPGGKGAEVFNDWSSSALHAPPYLQAAIHAVKSNGTVILSGAPSGNIDIPYAYVMHKNIRIQGQMMSNRQSIEATIRLITSGLLKVGRKGGAEVTLFKLEDFHEAEEHAAKHGEWKNYTYITPNS